MNSQNESSFGCFSKFQQLLMKKIFFLGPQNVTIFGVAFCLIFKKNLKLRCIFRETIFEFKKETAFANPSAGIKLHNALWISKKCCLKWSPISAPP